MGAASAADAGMGVAMTTSWGAPRAGYSLALAIARGDDAGLEELWGTLADAESGTDLLRALGAQARLMARTAATATGKPFEVPEEAWKRIICPDIRDFALAAYSGGIPRDPAFADLGCLRVAAEVLAELQLAAMDVVGLPREWLAELIAETEPQAPDRPHTPPPDAG
jgi:hypothetical protein